jgi:hypothetical protein
MEENIKNDVTRKTRETRETRINIHTCIYDLYEINIHIFNAASAMKERAKEECWNYRFMQMHCEGRNETSRLSARGSFESRTTCILARVGPRRTFV